MGTIQNIADRFWMAIGKTEKVYPVKVLKHQYKGNGRAVFDGIDRGRTLVDDQGNKTFELLDEPFSQGKVGYEDFLDTTGKEKVARIVMLDREHFAPLKDSYNIEPETYESEEDIEKYDIEKNALEHVVDVATFKEWAKRDFEDSAKIVETEDKKWWEQEKVQAAMLFVGAGLFFIFVGFALSETYLKDLVEQMGQNTEAVNQLREQLSSRLGGN